MIETEPQVIVPPDIVPTSSRPTPSRKRRHFRILAAALAVFALIVSIMGGLMLGPSWFAYWNYSPQEGDVIFQSLPAGDVVRAIEGSTHSPYSHCGIVGKDERGKWIVYEALHGVEITPLRDFLGRGRSWGFAVYRLKPADQEHVPAMLTYAREQLGKPYDHHYDLDDENIYCSELIYKGYAAATGGELGKLVKFGDLHWQPYQKVIEEIEGVVPVSREMITPRDLAKADQLELVTHFAIEVR